MHTAILCEVCKCTLVEKGVDSGHKSLGMKVLVDFDVKETGVSGDLAPPAGEPQLSACFHKASQCMGC
jgi:hypothetical protein